MTALAEEPVSLAPSASEKKEFANKLRLLTSAVRVRFEKLGIRKALTKDQLSQAAETFDADGNALSAAKKLLDTKDPSYRKVIGVKARASAYWRSMSSPYPEPGVRLIRRDQIGQFDSVMTAFKEELKAAAGEMQARYEELREKAKTQLGALFNAADYPARVDTQFDLEWDYPSIDPPAHLKDLHPELYKQECERIQGRMEESVRQLEQALAASLNERVSHLVERLTGSADGKPKVFRDSAVTNLREFFDEFKAFNLGSSGELDALVEKAKQAVTGIDVEALRDSTLLRNTVAEKLKEVTTAIDGMMIAKPKRAISLTDEQ